MTVDPYERALDANRRLLQAQQDLIKANGDRLRLIANLLYEEATKPDAPDCLMTAYAIARESR